jgi:hypothetical protein
MNCKLVGMFWLPRRKFVDQRSRVARGNVLVAWKKVCRPKEQGGFGVLNLEVQNQALLLKNLDTFYNNAEVLYVKLVRYKYYNDGNLPSMSNVGSFWWRSHLKLLDT